jgi:type IV pilus assembly protein PilB
MTTNQNAPKPNGQVSVGTQNLVSSLVKLNLITQADVDSAKIDAINKGESIESILVQQRKISEEKLYQVKAQMKGYKYIDVSAVEIPIDMLNRFSQEVAEKNMAISFGEENGKMKVAVSDPEDLQKIKFLQVIAGRPLDIYVSTNDQIKRVIEKKYGSKINEEVEEALSENSARVLDITDSKTPISQDISAGGDIDSAPVSRIVNMILEYAVKYKSSDVHIEARENKIVVRFRISGVLIEKLTLPKTLSAALVSRIKILSNLKIDEHRLPQDGRFQIKFGSKIFDLRVSIMPNVYGEKVVLRLLESGSKNMTLQEVGFRGFALKLYSESLKKTEGMILVTGPTGSGKTRTLASSLDILNNPNVNIQTLEDPVEIRMEGITQVQINPDIGLTFASGLRSFLRQDPDIIMVGEIRDSETANLAVQAALTGHLVLSTLHANYAAGAIPRLINMGVESFLLSSTVNAVVGQRLVRVICPHCKQSYIASVEETQQIKSVMSGLKGFSLKNENSGAIKLFRGAGCGECNGTGFVGRVGIFEVLTISEKISQLIMEHRSAGDIESQAINDGMITMKQDGFLKSLEGITTITEVLRVVN